MRRPVVSDAEREWRRRAAMTCAEAHVMARGHKKTREMQILALAAVGHSDEEIADELGIKQSTVGGYWKRALVRFGAKTRTEAVAAIFLLEIRLLRRENKELKGASVGKLAK